MLLNISVKDEKAELFLQLIKELKYSMIDRFEIVAKDGTTIEGELFDEQELLNRSNEIKQKSVKPLTQEEFFDGIC